MKDLSPDPGLKLALTGRAICSRSALDNEKFSGNTDDIHWAGTGVLTVENLNGSNAKTSRVSGGGSVVFETNKTLELNGMTEGARATLRALAGGPEAVGTLLVDDYCDSNGKATNTYNFSSEQPVEIFCRDSGTILAAIKETISFSDQTLDARDETGANDVSLFDTLPGFNHAFYFGGLTTFSKITINVSTAGDYNNGAIWEYWTGSAWASLSGVIDPTNDFKNAGWLVVSFTIPGDWATTTVNSQGPYFYVRLRFTSAAISGTVGSFAEAINVNQTKYLTVLQAVGSILGDFTVTVPWDVDKTANDR